MTRWLHERDQARNAGDKLAHSILAHLRKAPAREFSEEFAAALIDYHNDDGPAWALPPGEFMITRYDWTRDITIPVKMFPNRASAETELERLTTAETKKRQDDKENGRQLDKPSHYAIAQRP